MKHVKLFEDFTEVKRIATCFQGDSYAAVGIISEDERNLLQSAVDKFDAKHPTYRGMLRVELVDVTGMGYVKHDVDGGFSAMSFDTDPSKYMFNVSAEGGSGSVEHEYEDQESRLFNIVEGEMLVIDHHGHSNVVSAQELIHNYLGGDY